MTTATPGKPDVAGHCIEILHPGVKPEGVADVDMRPGVGNVVAAYPDHALDAAILTAEQFRREPGKWTRVFSFFLSTASKRTANARLAEERDPLLAQFQRIYGPDPHKVPGHPTQRQWGTHLQQYRTDPLLYLYRTPRFRAKAAELGLWNDDTDIERAEQRIRENEAELIRSGQWVPEADDTAGG